ncbi:MAG: EI24 domain-containing protein, partial [Lentisphaeria bacterium]|nr:EI24 domain-containing protein [Lentisphaeria bacterium]
LSGIANGAAVLIAFLAAAVIAISLLGVLYECFGGLFFDALIEKFSGKYYCILPEKRDLRFDLDFMISSAGYGIKTLLLSLPLMLLSLVFPVVGQIIFVVVMGWRFGICYPVAAGYCRRKSFSESITLLKPYKYVVAGFGISAYILLMLLPLAVVLLLPGIVLGGVILFHEKCSNTGSGL